MGSVYSALVIGRSGTGKSTSMRHLNPETTAVINVQGKALPFKGGRKFNTVTSDNFIEVRNQIIAAINAGFSTVVVDDWQFLMGNEFMRRANEGGWDKFTEIGQHGWTVMDCVKSAQPKTDTLVVFMAHEEFSEEGKIKIKTVGKVVDNHVNLEGMFPITLHADVIDGEYTFRTNGKAPCKSPLGMFESVYIDNDLELVRQSIWAYEYDQPMNYVTPDKEQIKQQVAKVKEAEAKVEQKSNPLAGGFTPIQEVKKEDTNAGTQTPSNTVLGGGFGGGPLQTTPVQETIVVEQQVQTGDTTMAQPNQGSQAVAGFSPLTGNQTSTTQNDGSSSTGADAPNNGADAQLTGKEAKIARIVDAVSGDAEGLRLFFTNNNTISPNQSLNDISDEMLDEMLDMLPNLAAAVANFRK